MKKTPMCRYGFVEFRSEDDADYAIKIMNMIKVSVQGGVLWSGMRKTFPANCSSGCTVVVTSDES